MLSAFAIELVHEGVPGGNIVLMLLMLGILAGGFQVLFGFVGIGRLIRYIPVSYTHLDVYKRQVLGYAGRGEAMKKR